MDMKAEGLRNYTLPGLIVAVGMAAALLTVFFEAGDQDQPKEPDALVHTSTPASFSLSEFRSGRWLQQEDRRLASSIGELGWIRDGVNETESNAIQSLIYIAVTSRSVASSVVALRWVEDGINEVEAEAIHWLDNMRDADAASSVLSLDWLDSDVDEAEVKAIEYLSYIANGHPQHAMKIVGMPFLESVEPPDLSAIAALSDLCSWRPGACEDVMSHPTIRDGITNDMAPIVATLGGVAETNPELIHVLLDPSRVLLERRIITLPISGDVILDIVRTAPGAARSMDLLEHSVRAAEEFMGVPFPTGHVVLLYENAVYGSNAGTNFGTHITILPKYDVDDGSHEAAQAGRHNAHEVAHYYWRDNADWVNEGAAEIMASSIDGMPTGQPKGVTNAPCGYARSIAELDALRVSRGEPGFECNYSLGERLFVDLHSTLGDDSFRQGFRELYAMSVIEDDMDNVPGTSVGIDDVRRAFGSGEGMANTVIARWYDGMAEPHDLYRLDSSPVDPRLSSINGRVDEAHIRIGTDGPAVSVFSAEDVNDWVYVALEFTYSLSRGVHEVPVEIVEYFEDGFEFSRRMSSIRAEARYTEGTVGFSLVQSPPRRWAAGRYVVYVYSGDRKVAEVEYEVTP